jgi:hypothetical protein
MTNRALKKALLDKLEIQPQGLSKRVQKKKALVPMSTAEATYLIAHEEGIKIDRYLTPEEVARVRALHVPKTHVPPAGHPERRGARARGNDARELRFAGDFRLRSPFLDAAKLAEAAAMSRIYPVLYVLENSIRELIKRVMKAKFGDDWWNTRLDKGKLKGVHERAAGRRATEKKNSWHQKRGDHPIDYADIGDLEAIILGHQDAFLPHIIPELRWFEHFMKELYPSRNVVCHMNPLTNDNVTDVQLKLRKWESVLRNAAGVIPA